MLLVLKENQFKAPNTLRKNYQVEAMDVADSTEEVIVDLEGDNATRQVAVIKMTVKEAPSMKIARKEVDQEDVDAVFDVDLEVVVAVRQGTEMETK
jgi:mRNA-degrading endonuclease HigB of HigAB toxin-antitoxin module